MADIHPQLKKDCVLLGRFPLSYLLLMNDSQYPWFILVPDRENICEIYQLAPDDRVQLYAESDQLSRFIMEYYAGEKLNLGAIGNLVPQLHLHHVVRFQSDPAWPKPVWGAMPAKPYSDEIIGLTKTAFTNASLAEYAATSI
ncbi:MAG: diadenosine tetraphosphate (Ap4A) HIT family hydrolase [Gammaproteobacteria bacterium]|jgi:diadenosine tetraphosphate (Ap4A) HIT family hydrolase